MESNKIISYLKGLLNNLPSDWLNLTTHRLDIYEEELAKVQFLEGFDVLYNQNDFDQASLVKLPTAYDYIRLGHPLSSVLEWAIAGFNDVKPENVISFSSTTMPLLAILRKNLLDGKSTHIYYTDSMPSCFDVETIKRVYGYQFEIKHIQNINEIEPIDGSTIFIKQGSDASNFASNADFTISLYDKLGSVLLINKNQDSSYISEIQHVRRRETIAMTPHNSLAVLKSIVLKSELETKNDSIHSKTNAVLDSIQTVASNNTQALIASSGLSIQYAILMGLIDDALINHPKKAIKIIVPTNCYGGTNDQARRIAACSSIVSVVDLAVDSGSDMVQSIEQVLTELAKQDAIPFIVAEIPTNPRVEVPDLLKLEATLSKVRKTEKGDLAIDPVFILDQTFCPNVRMVSEDSVLSTVKTISYVSGSKFPSAGKCTAGYCIANKRAQSFIKKIENHLTITDNKATDYQIEMLAEQMPSMELRIKNAYINTREFVNFISQELPDAKINFVSEELASQGFTPSVFSLDLPTRGDSEEEREVYKRELNLKLINMMIANIPSESKFCVSYGQLKGCYWTVPATSTQGTTKESDKDYIVRVSVSASLDLNHHKTVFLDFVKGLNC